MTKSQMNSKELHVYQALCSAAELMSAKDKTDAENIIKMMRGGGLVVMLVCSALAGLVSLATIVSTLMAGGIPFFSVLFAVICVLSAHSKLKLRNKIIPRVGQYFINERFSALSA